MAKEEREMEKFNDIKVEEHGRREDASLARLPSSYREVVGRKSRSSPSLVDFCIIVLDSSTVHETSAELETNVFDAYKNGNSCGSLFV